ncbi:hypothetical protein CDAR_66381 [Caerostris darwini]|uniref:Uncharacterized protein n=1 Tax=Caerostris darwini TaxID=1538125 RepID=A0AAV4RYL5_9ARAC|nr:hypothetical protein CDAR_66381 [Caerostris darwini]
MSVIVPLFTNFGPSLSETISNSSGIDELLVDKALNEDEIIEVALEIPVPKERSDKDEENPVLKADLLKGFELVTKMGNHFLNMILIRNETGSFNVI